MAELAASIIGIVSAGTKVTLVLSQLAADVGSAGKEARMIASEIRSFCAVAKTLGETLEKIQTSHYYAHCAELTKDMTDASLEMFTEILAASESVRNMARGKNGKFGFVGRVQWAVFQKPKITVLRAALEAYKSNLALMLGTLNTAEKVARRTTMKSTLDVIVEDEQDRSILRSLELEHQASLIELEQAKRLSQQQDESDMFEKPTPKLVSTATTMSDRTDVTYVEVTERSSWLDSLVGSAQDEIISIRSSLSRVSGFDFDTAEKRLTGYSERLSLLMSDDQKRISQRWSAVLPPSDSDQLFAHLDQHNGSDQSFNLSPEKPESPNLSSNLHITLVPPLPLSHKIKRPGAEHAIVLGQGPPSSLDKREVESNPKETPEIKLPLPDMVLVGKLLEEISWFPPAIAARKLLVEHYISIGWWDVANEFEKLTHKMNSDVNEYLAIMSKRRGPSPSLPVLVLDDTKSFLDRYDETPDFASPTSVELLTQPFYEVVHKWLMARPIDERRTILRTLADELCVTPPESTSHHKTHVTKSPPLSVSWMMPKGLHNDVPFQYRDQAQKLVEKAMEQVSKQLRIHDLQTPRSEDRVTIDLSHEKIVHLPLLIADHLQAYLERLALSHNRLTRLPQAISWCSHLRYLNLRSNRFNSIPGPVLELQSLEILDMSKNRLQALPESIWKLGSLKVLAVMHNQLRAFPLALGNMKELLVLKYEDNPIIYPPDEAMDILLNQPENRVPRNTEDPKMMDIIRTDCVKKYLRDPANSAPSLKVTQQLLGSKDRDPEFNALAHTKPLAVNFSSENRPWLYKTSTEVFRSPYYPTSPPNVDNLSPKPSPANSPTTSDPLYSPSFPQPMERNNTSIPTRSSLALRSRVNSSLGILKSATKSHKRAATAPYIPQNNYTKSQLSIGTSSHQRSHSEDIVTQAQSSLSSPPSTASRRPSHFGPSRYDEMRQSVLLAPPFSEDAQHTKYSIFVNPDLER